MPLETVTTLNTLNSLNPTHDDSLSDCDAHLRNIKRSLVSTFPNVTGPVTVTQGDLNGTSGIPPRVAALEAASNHLTGNQTLPGSVVIAGTLSVGFPISVGGFQLIPYGVITMWAGVTTNVPGGWALCDGSRGTPNLFNRFILGAGDIFTPGQQGGAASYSGSVDAAGFHGHGGVVGFGGAHYHPVGIDQQGSHNHGVQTQSHVLTTAEIPSHNHPLSLPAGPQTTATAGGAWSTGGGSQTVYTGSAGSDQGHVHGISDDGLHTHTVSLGIAPEHTHGIGGDGNHAHTFTVATTPPYYAICFIMKL